MGRQSPNKITSNVPTASLPQRKTSFKKPNTGQSFNCDVTKMTETAEKQSIEVDKISKTIKDKEATKHTTER